SPPRVLPRRQRAAPGGVRSVGAEARHHEGSRLARRRRWWHCRRHLHRERELRAGVLAVRAVEGRVRSLVQDGRARYLWTRFEQPPGDGAAGAALGLRGEGRSPELIERGAAPKGPPPRFT